VTAPKKLLWDFFGPHAPRTAEHFSVHLKQFLDANGLSHVPVQLESAGTGHCAVGCVPEESARPKLEAALRPNRVLELPIEQQSAERQTAEQESAEPQLETAGPTT
jgi:hypothetical protein